MKWWHHYDIIWVLQDGYSVIIQKVFNSAKAAASTDPDTMWSWGTSLSRSVEGRRQSEPFTFKKWQANDTERTSTSSPEDRNPHASQDARTDIRAAVLFVLYKCQKDRHCIISNKHIEVGNSDSQSYLFFYFTHPFVCECRNNQQPTCSTTRGVWAEL